MVVDAHITHSVDPPRRRGGRSVTQLTCYKSILATGTFLDAKRNAIFIGGTGTGKTHLCIAVASAVIRARARGRFFNLVDLVNQLEQEKAAGRQRTARPRSCCATTSSSSTSSATCRSVSLAHSCYST